MKYTQQQIEMEHTGVVVKSVQIPLDKQELSALEYDIYSNTAEMLKKKEELKSTSKRLKDEIAAFQTRIEETVQERVIQHKTVECNCYKVPDQDTGIMNYVDENNLEIVDSRPLKNNERQDTLKMANAVGY